MGFIVFDPPAVDFTGISMSAEGIGDFRIAGMSGGVLQWGIMDDEITHKCHYCGSHSPDDPRGNCSACGAPRA